MKTSLPSETLDKVKRTLESQKILIEKQLSRLKKDDPFLDHDRSFLDEPGTESMEEEGHRRVESNINESERLLAQIKKAMSKLGIGNYGICEYCGKPIDPKRLEVFPMATLCLSCETKKDGKR